MSGIDFGMALLAVCMVAIAIRLITAPLDADRAVAGDLLMFAFAGMVALLGIDLLGDYFFDIILVASVVGFLSAISLARALTRGRR
ncbi:monovalent cation/H+ antiporter complex subunit F [Enteractinococcus helveticum]|uniref:Pesticidal protein Cry26Aa n=1 Tax=Enteractinococcus helveticum TaxID=1837282 RepID=A0A1B7LXD1_9MICC|nr:monovalent cation/H+ antiporter complex subunit F [Enteractinococcus helveticum]OAV59823.1 pesticidal protein Cry26Aa [Enteractinococcus helveticum]